MLNYLIVGTLCFFLGWWIGYLITTIKATHAILQAASEKANGD